MHLSSSSAILSADLWICVLHVLTTSRQDPLAVRKYEYNFFKAVCVNAIATHFFVSGVVRTTTVDLDPPLVDSVVPDECPATVPSKPPCEPTVIPSPPRSESPCIPLSPPPARDGTQEPPTS
eukprot:scpid101035/ scgid27378/ 